MPNFRIACTTVTTYWATVSAPTKEAAEKFYDSLEGEAFIQGDEDGWDLDEIYEDAHITEHNLMYVCDEEGNLTEDRRKR